MRLSVRFQGGPPGRPRRRHGAHASAPADAPATAAPTPVGWRGKRRPLGPHSTRKSRGRGGFDKGTLAMAHIGLMRAGQSQPDRQASLRAIAPCQIRHTLIRYHRYSADT